MQTSIVRTAVAGLLSLSLASPLAAQSPLAPYVAPPMNLTVRPLRLGTEFVLPDKDQVVFQGQSVTVHIALSNLFN
jgi:hypothetical protein